MSIGVTGHRLDRVSRKHLEHLTPEVRRLLARLAGRSPAPARLWLASALADGSDQHLAALALEAGWSLHAVLPFEAGVCERDLAAPAARQRFRHLLARAAHVTELAGPRDRPAQAYRQLGDAVIQGSDLLMAVWDGEPARGPGGTGEVVGEALRRHVPVIHLDPRAGVPARLLWQRGDPAGRRHAWPCEPARLASAVRHATRRRA